MNIEEFLKTNNPREIEEFSQKPPIMYLVARLNQPAKIEFVQRDTPTIEEKILKK